MRPHILNSPVQKLGKKRLFFFGKILYQLIFDLQNTLRDTTAAGFPLGQNKNALTALVLRVRTDGDEIFLFHAAQKTGNCRVAQMKNFFYIPWARGVGLTGEEA